MHKYLIMVLTVLFFLPSRLSFAQSLQIDQQYWGNDKKYLETQAAVMLRLIDQSLDKEPPSTDSSAMRQLALYGLDAILHDTRLDGSKPMTDFLNGRISKVNNQLESPLTSRAEVYKIYNHGFIVRTKSATIAVDLVTHRFHRALFSDSLTEKIIRKCDALFLTHCHSDHCDKAIVSQFLKERKPVYAPSDFLPENDSIIHLIPDTIIKEKVRLRHGRNIKLQVLPGHQSELQCNNYVFTLPGKITVVHTGDEYQQRDMNWIPRAHQLIPPVDILIVNCWADPLNDIIDGYKPKLVITGHENEFGHSIDHREAFWLTNHKMQKIGYPFVLMGWGERYCFR